MPMVIVAGALGYVLFHHQMSLLSALWCGSNNDKPVEEFEARDPEIAWSCVKLASFGTVYGVMPLEIVMVPEPFVIEIPEPAVRLAAVDDVPVAPTINCPFDKGPTALRVPALDLN